MDDHNNGSNTGWNTLYMDDRFEQLERMLINIQAITHCLISEGTTKIDLEALADAEKWTLEGIKSVRELKEYITAVSVANQIDKQV